MYFISPKCTYNELKSRITWFYNYYTYTQRAHKQKGMLQVNGCRLSYVIRSLGLRLTVRRSWVRNLAAVAFEFSTSFFLRCSNWNLVLKEWWQSPKWTQPFQLNTQKLNGLLSLNNGLLSLSNGILTGNESTFSFYVLKWGEANICEIRGIHSCL